MKRYGYLMIAVIVIALIPLIPTQKKRIVKVIEACRQAFINEDINGLMEQISFNYNDSYGGSYLQFKKRAEMSFNTYDDFEIEIDLKEINAREKEAEARLNVLMIASAGSERGYLAGDAGAPEKIAVYLEKTAYDWKVSKIEKLKKFDGTDNSQ